MMEAFVVKLTDESWLAFSEYESGNCAFSVDYDAATIFPTKGGAESALTYVKENRKWMPKNNAEVVELIGIMYEKPIGPAPNFPDVKTVVDDGGSCIGYMAKGHGISPENFVGGIFWEDDNLYEISVETVQELAEEQIVRCVPVPKGSDMAFSFMYHPSKPGRGAFKATFLYI